MNNTPELFSVGRLADELDIANHQVKYLIDTLGLEPVQRTSRMRLFSREHLCQMRAALDARREARQQTSAA